MISGKLTRHKLLGRSVGYNSELCGDDFFSMLDLVKDYICSWYFRCKGKLGSMMKLQSSSLRLYLGNWMMLGTNSSVCTVRQKLLSCLCTCTTQCSGPSAMAAI